MAGLADWLEDYRNWRGRQEWEQGKGWQDFFGGDPRAQEQFEKLSGFGTDAGGLVGMIKASHGSPHAFDKFDFTKIGTGEGAQAYGHGGYFAQGFDSPVAQQYRDALSSGELRVKGGGEYDPSNPAHMAAAELMNYGGNSSKAISDIQKSIAELGKIKADWRDRAIQEKKTLIDLIGKGNLPELEDVSHGHLYNVELKWPDAARESADPLGEHHLLDWDAPMSKQPPEIINALRQGYKTSFGVSDRYLDDFLHPSASVGEAIGGGRMTKVMTDNLRSLGIPGIRYLDRASRGAGEGTRNYVMFDDALANIVSRNGVSLSDLLRR